jgi:peptidoglycan/LPS O-acetylase OafA/YrhL
MNLESNENRSGCNHPEVILRAGSKRGHASAERSDLIGAYTKRFAVLDSWRGICACLVAIHNFQYPQAPSFIQHSFLFVDFFFALSGFVVTHAYMHRFESPSAVAEFMVRRFGRLWPLHSVLLISYIAIESAKFVAAPALHLNFQGGLFDPPNSISSIVRNVVLTQAVGAHTSLSLNSPSWSISTEFWTYLLFALICTISPRRPPSAIVMGAICLFAAALIILYVPNLLASNTDYAFARCLYGFFGGHLAYRIWQANEHDFRSSTLLEISAVLLVIAFVCFAGSDALSMAAPLVFGFTVLVFATEGGAISRKLKSSTLVTLGAWSYSIYMVHWPIRGFFSAAVGTVRPNPLSETIAGRHPWDGLDGGWRVGLILGAYLVATVLISAMTYRWIEAPGRKYFNSIASLVAPRVQNRQ